jgi:hypothetical protein
MSDDKSKQDDRDRSTLSAEEPYEVDYFMTKHDISRDRALELIKKHDGSRKKIESELGQR